LWFLTLETEHHGEWPLGVINSRQIMSASAAAFFESGRHDTQFLRSAFLDIAAAYRLPPASGCPAWARFRSLGAS